MLARLETAEPEVLLIEQLFALLLAFDLNLELISVRKVLSGRVGEREALTI